MIIKDIRREFFDALKGRILIMCALDVDAICACRILQFLLESHNLQYSIAPVASVDNLSKSFEEYRNSVDSIVTINFGNLINIPKFLKPSETLNFYVIDSHRPINIYNYYKNPQVKLFITNDERELKIPSSSKIILKGDNGESEGCDEEASIELLTADARTLTNEQLEKRRRLREWLLNKQKLMFDYEEYQFYGKSVSTIMYNLAHDLSKGNKYLLWLAIVGITYQLKSDKIEQRVFDEEVKVLNDHVASNNISTNQAKGNAWTIIWRSDLRLDLYRRWTVYDSFSYTPLTVCNFKLWNDKGISDMRQFLVDCGLMLKHCQNSYVAMDLDFRYNLLDSVTNVCLGDLQYKYNLQDLITRSFIMTCGFKDKFNAGDVALAVRALLESHNPNLTITEKFVRAVQSLSENEFKLLDEGFEAARLQMKSMFDQVKILITTMKVIDMGVFLQVDLQESDTASKDFAQGNSLMAFSKFLLTAYVDSKPRRIANRAARLPLVMVSPDYCDMEQVLIAGIPPVAQETKKNFFAKAFQQAADNIECEIKADLSETNLIRINIHHKNQLLEQLRYLLDE